jgi:hypothetical protein
MRPAAHAGLLGNASLLTATYGKICVELKRRGYSVRMMRVAGSGEATMTTTIQGQSLTKAKLTKANHVSRLVTSGLE